MKNKMFGFLKNLLRQPADSPAPAQPAAAAPGPKPTPVQAYAPASAGSLRRSPGTSNGHGEHGTGVAISLRGILASLPLEVQGRVLQKEVGDLTVSIPLEKVLSQLSRGSVKVQFGELRVAAPAIFSQEPDRDRVLVPLPLAEIVGRINPALIACRRVQRKVEVPEHIRSPFDAHGQGLVLSTSSTASGSTPAPRQVTPAAPEAAPQAPAAPIALAPERQNITFTPSPAPPSAAPMAPRHAAAPPTTSPPASKPPVSPSQSPVRPLSMAPSPVPPPAAPVAKAPEAAAPAPAAPKPNGASLRLAPTATTPKAPEAPAAPAGSEPEPLVVGLTALAEAWPDALRKEIVEVNLVDTKLALPYHAVEQALRLGRISFSWKTLRGWLRPLPASMPSVHDGTVLELPLKVVAPLFLARQREATKEQQKVAIDDEIPNLFFGAPPVDASGAAVATPDTNYYVWSETSDSVPEQELESRHPSAGTKFITKYATPNEIVSRAAAIEGVLGALIALPDGLMVANRLPADINGDTLAAFLPQIFAKVSQCTRELRMGELNNLNFTVGNVPWKIFRVNAIFFAAFGKTGQALPTAQLAALAAELDHKPK